MALRSQTLNNRVRSQFMTSRRRRRKRPTKVIVGFVLVLLASLTVWWISSEATPSQPVGPAADPLVAAVPVVAEETSSGSNTAAAPPTRRRPTLPPARVAPVVAETDETAPAEVPPEPAPVEVVRDTVTDEVRRPAERIASTGTTEVEVLPERDEPAASAPKGDPAPVVSTPPLLSASETIAPPTSRGPRDEIATLSALADRDPIRVREELTELLVAGGLAASQERNARETLNRINGRLLFSPHVQPDDPFVRTYSVQPGDSLERIARRELAGGPDWRFVQRINGIRNPRGLQINQRLKLPVGTFHAVVDKSEFRMDLFLVDGGRRVLVASYPVGLGELNSTPEGVAKVRKGSKLIDPEWYNPRTSEYFAADDPGNPIGEHWIGLSSVESGDRLFDGYGIHGTIEPDSIGRSESMGCVRLLPEHVAVVYEMLTEPDSTVEVRP